VTAQVVAASGRGGSPLLVLLGLVGLGLLMSQVNQVALETSQNISRTADHQPDGGLYRNQLPERLADEVEAARQVGVRPVRAGGPGFNATINQGKVKFVLTESGELFVGPHTAHGVEISHAVLSGGRPVLAAGEADIAAAGGRYVGITLTPHSGHFRPSPRSLELARKAFEAVGITF
jgi:hypothetical protein